MKNHLRLLMLLVLLVCPFGVAHAEEDVFLRVVQMVRKTDIKETQSFHAEVFAEELPGDEEPESDEDILSQYLFPPKLLLSESETDITTQNEEGQLLIELVAPENTEAAAASLHAANSKIVEAVARMVWWEARGESDEGQQAVAQVILNRLECERFPNTIEKVLSQPNQFSPYENSDYHRVKIDERCVENVKIALQGGGPLANDVYFFKAARLSKNWYNFQEVAVIGGHRFYRYGA